MMKSTLRLLLTLALLAPAFLAPVALEAQSNIRSLDGGDPAEATLDQVAWIAGSWVGRGFGGTFEEVWTSPRAGSMVGLYKHGSDEAVNFYEIQLIVEEEGTLLWKVKHFSPDFVGWEEKDGYVTFPLVEVAQDTAWFDGLTIKRDGPDRMTVWLRVSSDEGSREERLDYERVPLVPASDPTAE